MALDLFMLGLIVQDMAEALTFYRQLGVEFPSGSEKKTHVEVKMGTGLTFFLDSGPERWDPNFVRSVNPMRGMATDSFPSVLEFYLLTQDAVEAKYAELTNLGYQGRGTPYATPMGMCFAWVYDPDGNAILLSGDLRKNAD